MKKKKDTTQKEMSKDLKQINATLNKILDELQAPRKEAERKRIEEAEKAAKTSNNPAQSFRTKPNFLV